MTWRTAFSAAFELVGWWVGLTLLWLVLIGPVDTVEGVVGLSCAAVGAVAARLAGRAVTWR
ncbi:hypothetical protein AB0C59_32595 [Streptomyces sp. NPDC048664]|uniref:hypothetical protein n=1 Tax=Streptomyces sp. NPDC048664 TaxID=3154505 RepID=UPI0034207378